MQLWGRSGIAVVCWGEGKGSSSGWMAEEIPNWLCMLLILKWENDRELHIPRVKECGVLSTNLRSLFMVGRTVLGLEEPENI